MFFWILTKWGEGRALPKFFSPFHKWIFGQLKESISSKIPTIWRKKSCRNWGEGGRGGNLDKIQKNSNFFSWNLPLVCTLFMKVFFKKLNVYCKMLKSHWWRFCAKRKEPSKSCRACLQIVSHTALQLLSELLTPCNQLRQTQTHIDAHRHKKTHRQIDADTQTLIQAHIDANRHTQTHRCTHTRILTQTRRHSHAGSYTDTLR